VRRPPLPWVAAARRRHADRDRYDERGDTLIEILMTLIVLSIAVVALIVTFATGISASVDHKNLAANDVVLRQVEEQAFYTLQQKPTTPLYKSCASVAVGQYATLDTSNPLSNGGNIYYAVPSGDSVTLNPIQYWDTTVSPATFDGNCALDSPQLISLTLGVPNGSSATMTFVVDDLGAGTTSGLSIATLTPNSAVQGTSNLSLSLTGTGFASDATVAFSGTGILVNSTTFVTSTLLDLNVTVAANAPTVAYTITVTNPGLNSLTSGNIFTVYGVITTGMHVSGISSSPFLGFLTFWPIVKVTVVDGNGHLLRHATVTGMWSPPNANPGGITTTTCTTDGSGSCYILYGLFDFFPPAGTETYTVTNLSATGQTYTQPTPQPSITVTVP
jgi:type II secretory pathway pseudopilin PulG